MAVQVEDFLGYWLFYAQRSVAYAFNEALKNCCLEHGKAYAVTPPQWGVLILLHECDGMTMSAISKKRAVDMPTVTGIIKRLEQSELVERRHDREDRRQVKVYLTDEGRDIMRYLPDAAGAFSEIMMRGFSEEQQRDLVAKLQQIIVNVGEVGPDTGDRFGLLLQFFNTGNKQ
jgi:MarR family transcriptional regulator, organic hydroperoxide resistance regulator